MLKPAGRVSLLRVSGWNLKNKRTVTGLCLPSHDCNRSVIRPYTDVTYSPKIHIEGLHCPANDV